VLYLLTKPPGIILLRGRSEGTERVIPGWSNYRFQSSYRSYMHIAQRFHDYVLLILILVIILIRAIFIDLALNKVRITRFTDYSVIEVYWTILPGVVLLFIAYPSLRLLYFIDEVEGSPITINTLGHQWFWEYNFPNYNSIRFESYIQKDDIAEYTRLLDVDNRVTLPTNIFTRVVVSSVDVIHSWTVPSLGTKVDAVPGRLNQIGLLSSSSGVYFGQCSEICGANHRFMPIVVEFIPLSIWLKWLTWCGYKQIYNLPLFIRHNTYSKIIEVTTQAPPTHR
jgi:cytochrome c oxidase subunit 2